MPLHDWTRVPAGLFHHFHQFWAVEICRKLNRGRLPPGLSALVEPALFEISYALFGRSAREGRTAVAGRGSQRRLWRSRSIVDPKTGIA